MKLDWELIGIILLFLISIAKATSFGIPINTSVIPSNYPNYHYQVVYAPYEAYFKNNSNSANSILFIKDGYSFTMDIHTSQVHWYNSSLNAIVGMQQEMNPQNTQATIIGSTITYPNAWINTDLQYTLTENGLKETLIISNISKASSTADYLQYGSNNYFNNNLSVCANGVCYLHVSNQKVITQGIVEFKDAKNTTVFWLPAPFLNDSAGNRINGTYALTINNGILIVNIRIPKSFIDNATFPIYLDPTVTFSTAAINDISMSPLSDNSFVLAYCDDTNNDMSFQISYTNGTNIVAETDVDTSIGGCAGEKVVSVTSLTSNLWAIGWYNWNTDNMQLQFYNSTGANTTQIKTITTSVNGFSVAVSALNTTDIVYCWHQTSTTTINCSVIDSSLNVLTPSFMVDTGVGGSSAVCPVDVSAFNASAFVVVYGSYTGIDSRFATYYSSGVQIANGSLTAGDTGQGARVSVSALNDYSFVVGFWRRNPLPYATVFDTFWSNGTAISYENSLGAASVSDENKVSAFNSTDFVIGWYNTTKNSTYFATYLNDGTVQTARTTASSPAINTVETTSREYATNIRFCSATDTVNKYFIIAYANSTSVANWTSYYSNGTAWNGVCLTSSTTSCGLGLSALINFGSVNPGAQTTQDANYITATNNGNTATNVLINGSTWQAAGQSFLASYTHYYNTTGKTYAQKTALSSTATQDYSQLAGGGSYNSYLDVQAGANGQQAAATYYQNVTYTSSC